MRNVLDVTVCAHSRGGVGRWVAGLARGLASESPKHVSLDVPETHPGINCPVEGHISLDPPGWTSIPVARGILHRCGWLERSRAGRMERLLGIPEIMHLSGVQPFGRGTAVVVTFHDDTPWTDPGSHTPETLAYAGNLADLVRKGAGVLCNSGWSADRAVSVLGVPRERTGVAGGAADEMFSPGDPDPGILSKYGLEPGEYYLHVGSYVPRKNIPFLAGCFDRADTGGRKLVLAGAESWGDAGGPGYSEKVLPLVNVTDETLLSLYRGAAALLLPSREEGLGLPVLEAFACGVPVISSDGGALPETVDGHGTLLPVSHRESWVRALENGVSEEMRNMALSAPRPTWRTVAVRALDFYRSLL